MTTLKTLKKVHQVLTKIRPLLPELETEIVSAMNEVSELINDLELLALDPKQLDNTKGSSL